MGKIESFKASFYAERQNGGGIKRAKQGGRSTFCCPECQK